VSSTVDDFLSSVRLVIGWVNLSLKGDMINNTVISSSFVSISIPLSYAVCVVAKRKQLPYGLLQFFTGICILLMMAFQNVSRMGPFNWKFYNCR
jgi:hypothetical protein